MGSQQDPAERRRHLRLAKPFAGTWRGASGSGPCRITDISIGGCFVQSVAAPQPDEETTVTIDLTGDRTMAFTGKVVYIEPHMGFALRFRPLDPAEHDELARIIDALTGKRQ